MKEKTNIFKSKVFIIVLCCVIFGAIGVIAETIIIDVDGITSSKGNEGMTLNMTIMTEAGETWFMVYEDGLLVNTTELIPELFDGLVSYYKLDETSGTTAVDSKGLNNGTATGATVNVSGNIETAYDFDGVNDYILSSPQNPSDLSEWSYNIWFYANTLSSTPWSAIMEVKENLSYCAAVIGLEADGDLYMGLPTGSSSDRYIATTEVTTGEWHMVTFTYNSGGNAVTYLDGSEVDTRSAPGLTGGTSNHYFATKQGAGAREFDGKLDEIGIWNRSLTSNEVSELYNNGTGLTYTP